MKTAPVLYVEDEEYDAFFMQRAFKTAQVANPLLIVTDGQQALDYLQGIGRFANREQYPLPCLVLLDLNLPRVSGLEVLRWMREQPEFQAMPVVICSSSSNGLDIEKTQHLGIQDYLVKQSDPSATAKQVEGLKGRWLDCA